MNEVEEFASNFLLGSNFPASSEEEWLQYRWIILTLIIITIVTFMQHSTSRGFGLRSAHAYILVYDVTSPKVKLVMQMWTNTIFSLFTMTNVFAIRKATKTFFRVLCSSSSWGSKLQFLGALVRWAAFSFIAWLILVFITLYSNCCPSLNWKDEVN